MTFKDILKDSIIEGFQTDITTTKICVTLMFAVLLGMYIFAVYKHKTKSTFYSKDFNTVLATLPSITAGIVLAMQSSIVVSLGMVGALSIVRFRNAVKNTLDLAFLFWSISIGIIVGACLYEIGIILSIVVTLLLFGLDYIPVNKAPYILVINMENGDLDYVKTQINEYVAYSKIKSQNKSGHKLDLIVEVRTDKEDELMNALSKIESIKNMNLLSHDGEARF